MTMKDRRVDRRPKETVNRGGDFLKIAPAFPKIALTNRSLSTVPTSPRKRMAPHENIFLQTMPDGKIQASRSQRERDKNPDRICLDRRGLSSVPQLMGETNIRLLSLQHNLLSRLEDLQSFVNLVFLDIYDNQLERINGLDICENLRVLLIGKNRLKKIEGMGKLIKLEVLDVHGNQINQIEGLKGLGELKVLNLAGNQIRTIGLNDLNGLVGLQELNLRRNRLRKVSGLGETPRLQKLFLSNNEIHIVDDIWSITKAQHLKEVSLDNNPVAMAGDCVSFLVSYLPNLTIMNQMHVSESIRRTASAWRIHRETNKSDSKRSDVISNAKTNWELLRCLPLAQVTSSLKDGDNGKNDIILPSYSKDHASKVISDDFDECFKLPPIYTEEKAGEQPLEGSILSDSTSGHATDTSDSLDSMEKKKQKERPLSTGKGKLKSTNNNIPAKLREQGGDYLIEICGRCLNVYGQGALRFIDRPWNPTKANDVNTVKFNYTSFSGISTILGRLKQRFANVEHYVFRETNITCLGQLNALADVQGLTSLQIDAIGNSISEKNWRSYAIYRLSHWGLQTINGQNITDEEIESASIEFQGLSDIVLWSLPEALLQPLLTRLRIDSGGEKSAKQWLWAADPALRSVVGKEALQWHKGTPTQDDMNLRQKGKAYLGHLIDVTCSAAEKLQMLETEWPTILHQLIRDTLVDYSHLDSYMKKCMQGLN